MQIFDPVKQRYEPPLPKRPNIRPFSKKPPNPQYQLKINENIPGFKVIRSEDKRTL